MAAGSYSYVYRIEAGESVYVGKSVDEKRVHSHDKAQTRIGAAIRENSREVSRTFLNLPVKCDGDLDIAEDALIAAAFDHAQNKRHEVVNGSRRNKALWTDKRKSPNADWQLISSGPYEEGGNWYLYGEPFCYEANRKAVDDAVCRILEGNKLPHRKPKPVDPPKTSAPAKCPAQKELEESEAYFCYQFRLDGTEQLSYVGKSETAGRPLQHFRSSHNEKLKAALSKATTWPELTTFILPRRCAGDLAIAEVCLILGAQEWFGNLNGLPSARYAEWVRAEKVATDQRPTLLRHSDQHGDWCLQTAEFCHTENRDAVADEVRKVLKAGSLSNPYRFLPKAGAPIRRFSLKELSEFMAKGATGSYTSVFLVPVNQRPSAGRKALNPLSSQEDVKDRCLKFWPPSKSRLEEVKGEPPSALVATMHGVIVGAWSVSKFDIKKGVATSSGEIHGLVGQLFTGRFHQAGWPIWWLRGSKEPTWVGHRGSMETDVGAQ